MDPPDYLELQILREPRPVPLLARLGRALRALIAPPPARVRRKRPARPASGTIRPVAPPAAEPPPDHDPLDRIELSDDDPLLTTGEDDQVDQLAANVLEHFTRSRPTIASFPRMALRVLQLVEDRRATLDRMVSLIGQDVAVSAEVLRAANSVLHYRGVEFKNVRTAIIHLGMVEVGRIASAVAGRSLFDVEEVSAFKLYEPLWKRLFHRSMTVAFSAGWLAGSLRHEGADRAFSGGMFHDIGKTVALRSLSTLVMSGAIPEPPPEAIIKRVLEEVHVEVGVRMHRAWKLPEYLTRICLTHHDPELPDRAEFADVHLVRLVSRLAELRIDPSVLAAVREEVRESVWALRMDGLMSEALVGQIKSFAARVTTMFGVEEEGADEKEAAAATADAISARAFRHTLVMGR